MSTPDLTDAVWNFRIGCAGVFERLALARALAVESPDVLTTADIPWMDPC